MTDQARSFGTAADRYDRYRPTYAEAAVVWTVGERPPRPPPARLTAGYAGSNVGR